MRIEELTPEMPVTFLVRIGEEQLTFETKIIELIPKKRLVLAEAIIRNNKLDILISLCLNAIQCLKDSFGGIICYYRYGN